MPPIAQIGSTIQNDDPTKTTSLTTSYTQAAGTNRILVVCGSTEDTGLITSATFDGVSLTKLVEAGNASRSAAIWYLVAPAVKTANVVVNLSGSADVSVIIHSWENVDQTTPFRASAAATGSGNPSVVCVSAANDLVLDIFTHDTSGSNPIVGAGQTELADVNVNNDFRAASSYEAGAAPNVTMSWSGMTGGSPNWSQAAGSLQGSAGWTGGIINGVTLLGKVNTISNTNIATINEV